MEEPKRKSSYSSSENPNSYEDKAKDDDTDIETIDFEELSTPEMQPSPINLFVRRFYLLFAVLAGLFFALHNFCL